MKRPRFLRAALSGAAAFVLAGPGCAATEATTDVVYQVNSFRVPCVGVAPMSCLQVRRGAEATGDWQNFYAAIEGFDYEPGYLYHLLVREIPLPLEEVPADASSIRFELVRVIDKAPDPRLGLHDIWVLQPIEGGKIDDFDSAPLVQRPYIEFNVTRGEYLGNDGCSEMRGTILALDAERLRLGPPDRLSASCADHELHAQLTSALASVRQWRRDGPELALLDDAGSAILSFRKTD